MQTISDRDTGLTKKVTGLISQQIVIKCVNKARFC